MNTASLIENSLAYETTFSLKCGMYLSIFRLGSIAGSAISSLKSAVPIKSSSVSNKSCVSSLLYSSVGSSSDLRVAVLQDAILLLFAERLFFIDFLRFVLQVSVFAVGF